VIGDWGLGIGERRTRENLTPLSSPLAKGGHRGVNF
jgi:hypothetical protein